MYETTGPPFSDVHRHDTLNLKKKKLEDCLGNYMLENEVFMPSFHKMAKNSSCFLGIF